MMLNLPVDGLAFFGVQKVGMSLVGLRMGHTALLTILLYAALYS